jgi:hypothetical protein
MKYALTALGITAATFLGASCEPEPETPGEHIEEVGEEVGEAVDEISDEVKDAAEDARQ